MSGGGPPPAPYSHHQQQPPPRHMPGPSPSSSSPSSSSASGPPRGVPIEKVIDDVAVMGFSRDQVRGVLQELAAEGKSVDLNVVLDRLGVRG